MFYLSQIIGKPVYNHNGKPVAYIADLAVELMLIAATNIYPPGAVMDALGEPLTPELPVVTGVVAHTPDKHKSVIFTAQQIEQMDANGARLIGSASATIWRHEMGGRVRCCSPRSCGTSRS